MLDNLEELTPEQKKARAQLAKRALAKRKFLSFIAYVNPWFRISWHHEMIADALERVENGSCKRLMIFLPPRHGKSEMVSINFPCWVLGRDCDKSIMEASYSSELATEFGRQARNLVNGREYKNVFLTALSEDSQSKSTWSTNGRGHYNALGVGGSATGKGADILIIDDPLKNRKDADSFTIRENCYRWYQSTARTRLSPDGAVILVCTRWHDDDLAGRLLLEENAGDWEIINLPAIAEHDEERRDKGEALWPSQYSLENLTKTKAEVGIYEWSSLYQQNPINSETCEFKRESYKYASSNILKNLKTYCFITIDPAIKEKETADYTGIIINHVDVENNWYIKAQRVRLNSTKLIDKIFDLWATEHPQAIGIEEITYWDAIYPFFIQEMAKRNVFPVMYPLKHHGVNKELRIRGLLPRYEAGKIFHLNGECEALEEEQLRFPKGKNDDLVDALAYQDQIVVTPVPDLTYEQEVRDQMEQQIDDNTGYFKC
jgi:hypothetical protein